MNHQQPNGTSDDGGGAAPVEWAELAAGPADAVSLTALAGADPCTLGGAALVDAIVASEKAMSLLAGTQMRLLTALAVPFVAGDPMRLAARLARRSCITGDDDPTQVAHYIPEAAACLAAAEVAAALRIPSRTAGIRVKQADTMTGALAPTLQALENGTLDRGKARVIADHCQPLTPEQTQHLQDLVLPGVDTLTTSELRDITGQAVIIVDPDGADHRHQQAATRRELALQALPDAMATLKAYLPADGAVKIFQVTDLLATGTAGTPGDTRGIGARRVDALIDIADHLLSDGYIDLTDYLGEELPDHSTPTRARRRNTDTASSDISDTDTPSSSASHPGSTADTTDTSSTDRTSDASADTTDGTDETSNTSAAHSANRTDQDQGVDEDDGEGEGEESSATTARRGAGNRVFTRQGRRPHLSVTIALSTLAGLDNLPGTLAGFGAIPAGLARSIAASAATITTLITDPDTGVPTAAGALTYRPTQELRDRIAALHHVCQFPSCRQPVWRCDLDHRVEFNHDHPDQGGPTDIANTGPFCRRHHVIKHHSDWQIRIDPNRFVLEFTSPTGHHYRKPGRQAAAPGMWVSTAATAVAERLDLTATPPSTAMSNDAEPAAGDTSPTSQIENMLAAIEIRNHLNTRIIEIDYDPKTAWGPTETEDPPPF